MPYSARLARADRLVMHAGEVPAFRRVEAELPYPLRRAPALGQERDRLWQRWVTVNPTARCICRPAIDGDARRCPRTARWGRVTPGDQRRAGPDSRWLISRWHRAGGREASSTRPAARRVPEDQKGCRVMRSGSRVSRPPPRSAPYLTASAVSGQLIPLPRKRWGYGLAGGLVAG